MLRRHFLRALPLLPLLAQRSARADKKPASTTGIAWKVLPPDVIVWLDGKQLGEASSLGVTPTSPGTHTVRLQRGGDRTETRIKVPKGQVVRFEFDFG